MKFLGVNLLWGAVYSVGFSVSISQGVQAACYVFSTIVHPEPGSGNYVGIDNVKIADYEALNWQQVPLDVPKFDPTLGLLKEVGLTLTVELIGSGGAENLNAFEAPITYTLGGQVMLSSASGETLASVEIGYPTWTKLCAGFDGRIDYEGPSGMKVLNQTLMNTVAYHTNDPERLAIFTGEGSVTLTLMGTGLSSISGSGYTLARIATGARAELTVTYTYAPVPEPEESVLAGGVGLLGFTGFCRLARIRKSQEGLPRTPNVVPQRSP